MKKFFIFLVFLLLPLSSSASVYTTDFETDPSSDWSCVAGVCEWLNWGGNARSPTHVMYPHAGSGTTVVSPTTTNSDIEVTVYTTCEGSNTSYIYGAIQNGVQVPLGNWPSCTYGTYEELTFTTEGTNVYFKNSSAGNAAMFDDITVTSTPITPTSTTTTSTTTTSENQDLFYGSIIFLASFFGIAFLIKK